MSGITCMSVFYQSKIKVMEIRRHWRVAPMWRQLGVFLSVMFFVFLADGMLSDFVPGFVQQYVGTPLGMGLIMATSSVAGLGLDLLFAQLLRYTSVKPMMLYALTGCLSFVGLLLLATWWPSVGLFVLAMVSWGLYYEFFGFSSQKFVVGIAPPSQRTAVWSVLETMRALAYAIAPLLMAGVMRHGERVSLGLVAGLLGVGLVVFMVTKVRYAAERVVETHRLTVWHEVGHWVVLLKHIWPAVVMGVCLTLVDAVYWTTGTVVNDMLAEEHPMGGMFLTSYMASSLVVGFVMGRWEIRSRKKRAAQILILVSGLVLTQMQLVTHWGWYLLIVLSSSLLSAMAWPLLDAVYTDLLSRMGRENVHMVGLKNASNSIAYIVGPIVGGLLAGWVGELESFKYLGWMLVVVMGGLLVLTPRKLRLPQAEIREWD